MSESEVKQVKHPRGVHFLKFDGLHAQLRSKAQPTANRKAMLVSHSFIDLWREITEDHGFSQSKFDMLDEHERDFMKHALSKCKIQSKEFETAYNALLDKHVNRLKILQGAIAIGNDSPDIKKEIKEILDRLYEKGVFSGNFYKHLRKSLKAD